MTRSESCTGLVVRAQIAISASAMPAWVSEEAFAPGSKEIPYHLPLPALAARKTMGWAALPSAMSPPRTISSTFAVEVPEPSPSLVAASTVTPGSMVSVAWGATVTSPVRR